MEDLFNENVPQVDQEIIERKYQRELEEGNFVHKTQFEYARCLVMRKYPQDIQKGILFLEDLAKRHVQGKRDYIYYLAVGNAKIKEYSVAIKYCRAFLQIEPNNQQVLTLEEYVKDKMEKESFKSWLWASLVIGTISGFVLTMVKNTNLGI